MSRYYWIRNVAIDIMRENVSIWTHRLAPLKYFLQYLLKKLYISIQILLELMQLYVLYSATVV